MDCILHLSTSLARSNKLGREYSLGSLKSRLWNEKMNYFISDIKSMCKNKIVLITIIVLLVVMILDTISVTWHAMTYHDFYGQIGRNPFQFWLLMNSVSWGFSFYHTLFFVFPLLITGMLYFQEKKSSMQMFLATRKSRTAYFLSKIFSTLIFSFIVFFVLLSINLLVTYIIFPSNTPLTDYYANVIPNEGTFAYNTFKHNPLSMAFLYTFLNAFAIAIFAVFELSIQMIFNFKNQYVALIIPVILAYAVIFLFDSQSGYIMYNIQMVLQPRATNALSVIITWGNVTVAFAIWIFIDMILVLLGLIRNRSLI